MAEYWIKWLSTWGIAILAVVVGLSFLFGVPCVYTLLGFSAWVFVGHLVTIDDDESGGFSNPERSQSVWRKSLMELGFKLMVLLGLVVAVAVFPDLKELGAG